MHRRSLTTFLFVVSSAWCQPQVLVTGLQGPHKIILTPRGNLLVSETSMEPNAGRISFVTRSGTRRSLFEGLPSGTEVTLAGGGGPSALALRERTLYVAMGAGDSERRGPSPGTSIHNPVGASSPLFAAILEVRFNEDVDSISGVFRMTPEHQWVLADGGEVELSGDGAGRARVSVLTRFPISEPHPARLYRFSNLWGLALSDDGSSLYVADASMDSLARVETATGRWRRLVRFPPIQNTGTIGPPVIDSVPTSVRIYGDQLLVSFLSGFPFNRGSAHVRVVNPQTGVSEQFMYDLTSVTDVLWRSRPNARPQFFVLEFSANQSAQPSPPGRLLRFDTAEAQVAAAGLITPVSMAFDESTQDLYILELRGQILRLRLE